MGTVATVAEFIFDLLNVVKVCKLDDYEAGDAIAFTEGFQDGASGYERTNPYALGTVRHIMWKQGRMRAVVEGGVKYE